MAANYRAPDGVDLDSKFAARLSGVVSGNTSYRTGDGVDLVQRFEPLHGAQVVPNTGYRMPSGADIATIFDNTAGVPQNFTGSVSNTPSGLAPETGSISITAQRNGTFVVGHNPTGSGSISNWYSITSNSVIGDSYQVQFNRTAGTATGWSGTFGGWQTISSGISIQCSLLQTGAGKPALNNNGTIQIIIRRVSDGVFVCSGNISYSCTSGPGP